MSKGNPWASNKVKNLADVSISNVANDDGLFWDSNLSKWVNKSAGSGSGDVVGPATNTDNFIPQWNGDDSKTLKNGLAVGTAAGNLVQLDGDAKLPAVDGSLLTNLPSGFADPMTTRGDIIVRDSDGTTRLGIGTNGQVLTSDGTDVAWADAGGGGVTFNEPAADNSAGTQSIFDSAIVGESVAFPNLLYLKSDGKWWKADADAAASMPGLRMALESKTADQACSMLVAGRVRDDDWNWTVGGMIYASTTTGALTQTAPSGSADIVQIVGIAYHADKIIFNPSMTFLEIL